MGYRHGFLGKEGWKSMLGPHYGDFQIQYLEFKFYCTDNVYNLRGKNCWQGLNSV